MELYHILSPFGEKFFLDWLPHLPLRNGEGPRDRWSHWYWPENSLLTLYDYISGESCNCSYDTDQVLVLTRLTLLRACCFLFKKVKNLIILSCGKNQCLCNGNFLKLLSTHRCIYLSLPVCMYVCVCVCVYAHNIYMLCVCFLKSNL